MPRRLVPSKLRNRTIWPCSGRKSTGPIDSGGVVSVKIFRQIRTYLVIISVTKASRLSSVKVMARAAQCLPIHCQRLSVARSSAKILPSALPAGRFAAWDSGSQRAGAAMGPACREVGRPCRDALAGCAIQNRAAQSRAASR